jgi:hypothetical protein
MALNLGKCRLSGYDYIPALMGQDGTLPTTDDGFLNQIGFEENKWTYIAAGGAAFFILLAVIAKKKKKRKPTRSIGSSSPRRPGSLSVQYQG